MLRILVLLLLLPVSVCALQGRGEPGYDYLSRWGDVSFNHWRHQNRVETCEACHHLGVNLGRCASCHGVIEGLPQHKDVLHKSCINCHWQKKGPTECSGCHDPERVNDAIYRD